MLDTKRIILLKKTVAVFLRLYKKRYLSDSKFVAVLLAAFDRAESLLIFYFSFN